MGRSHDIDEQNRRKEAVRGDGPRGLGYPFADRAEDLIPDANKQMALTLELDQPSAGDPCGTVASQVRGHDRVV